MNGFPHPGDDYSFPSLGMNPQVQEQFRVLLRGHDSHITTTELCELARTLPGWQKASSQGLGKTFSSLVNAGVLQAGEDGLRRVFWLKPVPKTPAVPVVAPPPPASPAAEPDFETLRLDRLKKLYSVFPGVSFQMRQVDHEKIGLGSEEEVIKFVTREVRSREYLNLSSSLAMGRGPRVEMYSWVQKPSEVPAVRTVPSQSPACPVPPSSNDQLQDLFTKVAVLEAQAVEATEYRQFLVDQAVRACETVLTQYPKAIRSAALRILAGQNGQ